MVNRQECQKRYILENCSPEPNTGCFLWMGKVNAKGHAVDILPYTTNCYPVKIHRKLWELIKGERLGRLELWHSCGIKSCLNIDHMETVDPDGREPGNRRLLSNKIRAWQKEKRRRARRFEEWLKVNNGSDTSR